MSTSFNNLKEHLSASNNLMRIIYLNIAIFVLVLLVEFFAKLFAFQSFDFFNFFGLNADFSISLLKPWTFLTYSLFHSGFGHIIFNLILLYFSGQILLQYFSDKQLVSLYVLGVLAGAFTFAISINIFPLFDNASNSYNIVGSSAGALAVMIGIASYVPNYSVNLMLIGRVKLVYIAWFFIILDLINFQTGNNEGGHLAHIGGAIIGYIYGLQMRQGKDIGVWINNIIDYFANLFARKRNPFKKVYKNKTPRDDYDYNMMKKQQDQIIDDILGKISKSGYDSLTKQEKEFLFKSGKK